MWKTVLILLVTLIVIPFFAFYFDDPLTVVQRELLFDLLKIYIIGTGLSFIVSTYTGNYSQVDKLWSTIPIVYLWIITSRANFEPRILIMALLVTVWGIRLSINFARKGGYSMKIWSGEEDYRWAILRSKPEFARKWKWVIFNLFFISIYQMGIVLLMTLPALRSLEGRPLDLTDYILTGMVLGFILVETIADQQQWNFQKEKKRLASTGKSLPDKYKDGFISYGLWSIVRHPNYTSEQAIWIFFYLFSVSATGHLLNWSIMGALLLIILFYGSSNFSESISATKYSQYSDYKKSTPRFIPIRIGKRVK